MSLQERDAAAAAAKEEEDARLAQIARIVRSQVTDEARGYAIKRFQDRQNKEAVRGCPHCNREHLLLQCPQLGTCSPKYLNQLVKEHHLCPVCLSRDGHGIWRCNKLTKAATLAEAKRQLCTNAICKDEHVFHSPLLCERTHQDKTAAQDELALLREQNRKLKMKEAREKELEKERRRKNQQDLLQGAGHVAAKKKKTTYDHGQGPLVGPTTIGPGPSVVREEVLAPTAGDVDMTEALTQLFGK